MPVGPADGDQPGGPSHTVTVTVTDDNRPVGGVLVTVAVSGAHAGIRQVITNIQGQARFTYTGKNIGTDTIRASGDVDGVPFSCTAIKRWVKVACRLAPPMDTNPVGTSHTVTVRVMQNGSPVAGVPVTFNVISGPNGGTSGSGTTDSSGQATFTYTSNGTLGTDTIRASGEVDGVPFSCMATKTWVAAGPVCTLEPAMAMRPAGSGECQFYTLTLTQNGNPVPGVRVRFTVTSGPHEGELSDHITDANGQVVEQFDVCSVVGPPPDPPGTDTIEASGSVGGQSFSCTATLTWVQEDCTDTMPPTITCPADMTVPCEPSVVNYPPPTVTDDCPNPTVTCNPPSGSAFPPGTTTVTCTATDASGKMAVCSFNVTRDCGLVTSSEGTRAIGGHFLSAAREYSDGTLDLIVAESGAAGSSLGSFPPNTIVLTPTGDATLLQSSVLTTDGRGIQTAGPWLATLPTREGTAPIQMGGSTAFDLLQFDLVTGGFHGLQGRLMGSDVRTIGPTDVGAVAGLAFDLTSVKAFLSSQRLNPATMRASLHITSLRTGTVELFATDLSPAPPARSSTTVALLDTPSAPTQIIAFADFPGFSGLTSPARSNLGDLERAIAAAPMNRKATLPIGSAESLSQLTFDVSAWVYPTTPTGRCRPSSRRSRRSSISFLSGAQRT
ncbi:MAG: Ig-like domain-containing protein [Acidobacteria bacterium]|nr:Ig-like domain-containing protein [Acidobacteriota bacterium]